MWQVVSQKLSFVRRKTLSSSLVGSPKHEVIHDRYYERDSELSLNFDPVGDPVGCCTAALMWFTVGGCPRFFFEVIIGPVPSITGTLLGGFGLDARQRGNDLVLTADGRIITRTGSEK